jgi:hypothetical protein
MRHTNDPHNGYDRSPTRGEYRYPARAGGAPSRREAGRATEQEEQTGSREAGRHRPGPRAYPAPPANDRDQQRGREREEDRNRRDGERRGDGETTGDRMGRERRIGREPQAVHEVQVEHITVTIWQRDGVSGLEAYSLTVTRSFYSQRHRQYLTTTKLYAEDAVLAAEALGRAFEWVRQEIGDPLPF